MQVDMNHITQNKMIKSEIQFNHKYSNPLLVYKIKIILQNLRLKTKLYHRGQKIKYLWLKRDREDYQTIVNKPQHNWSTEEMVVHSCYLKRVYHRFRLLRRCGMSTEASWRVGWTVTPISPWWQPKRTLSRKSTTLLLKQKSFISEEMSFNIQYAKWKLAFFF